MLALGSDSLHIKFLGGAGEVGRSAFLLDGTRKILLDCGIKIDANTEYPLPPGRVDACIISHAHLDHSGFTPSLYGDAMPTAFATEPTMALAELLIEDSIKVHKRKHQNPHFHRNDLRTMLNRYVPCGYGKAQEFGEYNITMHDAGHICGSAITTIEKMDNGRRLVYTGDFKMENQLLEHGARAVKSDILIIESTYATNEHPDREGMMRKFVDEVREVVDNRGIALVPVFAVGRAQEMLALMNKYGLIHQTFFDGMARAATEIVDRYPEYVKNVGLLQGAIKKAMWVETQRNRKHALEGGSIILTTSGMLNGGPVLDYITRLNKNSKIFLTGYQAENTNGRRLMEGKPLDIDGKEFRVRTPFTSYDFSAHAGKSDMPAGGDDQVSDLDEEE